MDNVKSVKIMKEMPSFIKNQLKEKEISEKIFIDQEKCIGCGLCKEICPFGLPEKNDNKKFSINRLKECIECSACKRNCPVQAIITQEKSGCGCLWDVRNRSKLLKNKKAANSCC